MHARFDTHAWPFGGQDIRTLLRTQAAARRDHTCLIWQPFTGETASWSYGAFIDRTLRFAAGLQRRGIGPGDRILIHLENCPEAIIAWLGCAAAGAVAVTTNARSSADELRYFVAHCAARAAITQPKFAEAVSLAGPGLEWLAITSTDCGEPAPAPPKGDRFEAIDADPAILPRRAHDPAAPFGVQYTSGTTARPKAVLWTHANALWGGRISAAHEGLQAHDIHLITMPLFHTNAQSYSVLASFWAGATMVLQPRFSASRFWPVAVAQRCSWASMVPFCTRALATLPVPEHHFFRRWGNAFSAPPEDPLFGVTTIGWWGMTETITHGLVGRPDHTNTGFSMGRAAPEYEIRLLNDAGRPAAPGETGDLAIRGIRGLSVFAEYLDNPEATAAAFDEHGFLLTGDRAFTDVDGNFFFADRAKDMLKVGGENVSAAEIERVIMLVPGVREVAVVGRKHAMLDEVPVAFLLGAEPDDPTLIARVQGACHAALARFKQPAEIRVLNEFPRATLQKVAKARLRAILE